MDGVNLVDEATKMSQIGHSMNLFPGGDWATEIA